MCSFISYTTISNSDLQITEISFLIHTFFPHFSWHPIHFGLEELLIGEDLFFHLVAVAST